VPAKASPVKTSKAAMGSRVLKTCLKFMIFD
jgi:hypothetical protein